MNTTTSGGKLIFHVFGALAEFERDIIRERTRAGLAAARARGRMGGRPKKLGTPTKVAMAKNLYADHSHSIADICKSLGISRATLYRYLDVPADATADSPSEESLCAGMNTPVCICRVQRYTARSDSRPLRHARRRSGHRPEATMRALLPRLLVPILMLAAFVSGLQPVILGPLLPAIARAFAVSPAITGQLAAVTSLTAAATALLAVPLIDHFPRRTILRVEAALLLAATLLSAIAPGLAWLFAARIAAGVGSALILPASLAAAGDRFPDPTRRNRAVGLITAAASAAVVLGLPVLAQFVAHVGWRGALIAAMAPAAALLVGTGAIPATAVAHRDEHGWRAYRLRYGAVLAHRETRWLLGATLLFGAVWSGWFIYIGAYTVATFATGAAFLSALFLVAGVAEVLGSVATPWLLRTTDARVLTGIGLALTALALAALGVVFTRAWTLFAFIAIASVLGAAIYTTISVMALDGAPGARGAVLTLRAALFWVGWGIGPATAGAALAIFGDYRAGYRALGALSVLAIGCLARGGRRTRDERTTIEQVH